MKTERIIIAILTIMMILLSILVKSSEANHKAQINDLSIVLDCKDKQIAELEEMLTDTQNDVIMYKNERNELINSIGTMTERIEILTDDIQMLIDQTYEGGF